MSVNAFYNNWQGQVVGSGGIVGAGVDPSAIELYNMSDAERKQIALALKNAGYKVNVNGKYSVKLADSFANAKQVATMQASQLGQKFDNTYFNNFLIQEANADMGSGTSVRPGTSKSIRISDETTARTLINAVLQDAIGRGATDAELKKYTKALQTAQKASPTVSVTDAGGLTTTTGGINETQFLIQQVAGTDEAQANKMFSFYNAFKDAIGIPSSRGGVQ